MPADPAITSPGDGDEAAVSRLTLGLARGCDEAFREFHARYFHRLQRYLMVVAHGDELLAGDALQETYVRVARHARRFQEEKAFWDWLTVLGRSAVADGGRKQSRYRRLLDFFRGEPRAPATRGDEEDMLVALEAAMRQLEDEDRRLLLRKYYERGTAQQIAAEMGITEGAVESRLVRIRRELRGHLSKQRNHDES